MRPKLLAMAILLPALAVAAEIPVAVEVIPSNEPVRAGELATVTFRVTMREHWHIYAPGAPEGMPFEIEGALAEGPVEGPAPSRVFEEAFGMEIPRWEGTVELRRRFRIPPDAQPGKIMLRGVYRGQACDPTRCLPVEETPWQAEVSVGRPKGEVEAGGRAGARDALAQGPWPFFLSALVWGFATLLTPCVYPMVPVTIAFFSKQRQAGAASTALAAVYAAGIVLMFTVIGVLASLFIRGGVVAFGNNPWVNLSVGAIFVVFAISLFGAFDLTLPSGLLTRLGSGPRQGYGGALFLGFVFAVTSFACTAPFAGVILALGLQSGKWLWPVAGMVGFSTALALPFFLLAAFPGMLRSLPKGGGWMETVKHVCAFVELAAALKFLGAADIFLLEADFLTRPVVVALWAALSAACGLYLLGIYRFHGEEDAGVGAGRILFGSAFLALAAYFAAGMASGARLGPWEAFLTVPAGDVPPLRSDGHPGELPWHDDLAAVAEEARREGKRVFIDFTAPT